MATKETSNEDEFKADAALIHWASMGLPSGLAAVQTGLKAIATTGECRGELEDWVLLGEVVNVHLGPPLCVHVRRTSMLMMDDKVQSNRWTNFDVICPVEHGRVDFTPGMMIGLLTKPVNRPTVGRAVADALVPVWNLSHFDPRLAWNATHLFAGAYEGWMRAMWWLQQANVGQSFATHTSIDWCSDVKKQTMCIPLFRMFLWIGVLKARCYCQPKKARVIETADGIQVLLQRIIQDGDYLPTLCASYS